MPRIFTPKNTVRTFCVYDFLGLGLFAIPFVSALQVSSYEAINQMLGGAAIAAPDVFGSLALHLLGLLVIAWGIWRWTNPTSQIAMFEGILRLFYGPTMLWFGFAHELPIMVLAGAADLLIGFLHIRVGGGWKTLRQRSMTPARS